MKREVFLLELTKEPKIHTVSSYFMTDPPTCKLQGVKKQGFVLSLNARYVI
jgi:hypothetical protein